MTPGSLYIEAGQLLDFLRRRASLTGIQRLTLVCAKHLPRVIGHEKVQLLAFVGKSGKMRTAPAAAFMRPEYMSSDHLNPMSRLWRDAAIGPDDAVLFTECWWWHSAIGNGAVRLKEKSGARAFRFVHDVIPALAPQYVTAGLPRQFLDGLKQVAPAADVILTNSAASRDDIQQVLEISGLPARPVTVVPLAHEFEMQQHFTRRPSMWHALDWNTKRKQREAKNLIGRMRHQPHVVAVGTLEERKNILRLLQVWQRLAVTHGDALPRLILVGRWGWDGDVIKTFLRKTGNIGGRVEVMLGVDDATLRALYEHSLFTIYLSHYEGWGLPVGESMWLGKPVLASNTSSIPEVGGKLVDYVDPVNDDEIASAIEKLSFDHAYRARRIDALKSAKLRSWDDFTKDLAAKIGFTPIA